MKTPRVDINLKNIKKNVELLRQKCESRGIRLTGVVKGAAGDLRVAEAFVNGGLESIGDSRLRNIKRFREAGINQEMVLLRLPQLGEVEEVVKYTDICLISEIKTIKALAREAVRQQKKYGIIVMVDVGDLREGVLPDQIDNFFAEIIELQGIEIKGLGTNVGCYGGVLPSVENTALLLELKEKLEKKFSLELTTISGGNTATTVLLENDTLPEGINNFRVGEALLQGTDITNQRMVEGLNQNNFKLTASIIEIKEKPSVPIGEIGHDAFGNKPVYEDRGIRKRAILAVGKQDVKIDGLIPLLEKIEVLGASSDHLIVDITDVEQQLEIGDELSFYLDYGAMLSAMTSSYVAKSYLE